MQWILSGEWSQIAKFMGPAWGPPGSCRSQMGPMLAPWTLLSGIHNKYPLQAVVEFTVELEGQESPDCAGAITSLVSNVNTFKSTFRPLEMFSVSCSSGSTVTIEPTEVNIVLSDTAKIIQSCPDGQTLQDAECCKYQRIGDLTIAM